MLKERIHQTIHLGKHFFGAISDKAGNLGRIVELIEKDYGHKRTRDLHECRDRDGKPIAWYTYPAIEYAKQLDFSNREIFEYGSGFSSVFWGNRAKRVVSLEHEREWHEKMSTLLPKNVEYRLETDSSAYPLAILDYSQMFDVIIIDGEQRSSCVSPALQKLKSDGLIIVDNSDWFPGICATLRAADLIEVDFQGFGPINPYTWTTSFFFTRSASFSPSEDRQPVNGPGSIHQICDTP